MIPMYINDIKRWWWIVRSHLDRKCFVIQDCVEALDQHADSLKEKLGFQWFATMLRNFASLVHQERRGCDWPKLIGCKQFSIVGTFSVSSLFSSGSCCTTCSGHVWSSRRGADCDIPCQRFTSAPWNKSATTRALSIAENQAGWFFLNWNVCCTEGAYDTFLQCLISHHTAGDVLADQATYTVCIHNIAATATVRTANLWSQPQRNSDANSLIIKSKSTFCYYYYQCCCHRGKCLSSRILED